MDQPEFDFNLRNQQVYMAFAQFDLTMLSMARHNGYDFSHACGTTRGRSLLLTDGTLRKMVCFNIKNSILDVDVNDLQVDLGWAVWLQEFSDQRIPFWFLKRDYFSGSINELSDTFKTTLAQMMADLNLVTQHQVKETGKYHAAPPCKSGE